MARDRANVSTSIGAGVRAGREAAGLSVRGLAQKVGVSASLISQIENGRTSPSIATLHQIVAATGVSMDELFPPPPQNGSTARKSGPRGRSALPAEWEARSDGHVLRPANRLSLTLAGGVRWSRLTASREEVEFLEVTYPPHSESCSAEAPIRHRGREYGLLLSGRLGATIGTESYELGPGDSVAFDSLTPHRLWNGGEEVALAVWTVVGRGEDPRLSPRLTARPPLRLTS